MSTAKQDIEQLLKKLIDRNVSFYHYDDFNSCSRELGIDDLILLLSDENELIAKKSGLDKAKISQYRRQGLVMEDIDGISPSLSSKPTPPIKDRDGFIYLIQESTKGFYKIGRTINLKSRLRTHGVKLPFLVKTVFEFKCTNYKNAEQLLHEYFKSKRIDGEWFLLSDNDIELLKNGTTTKQLGIEVLHESN